MTDFEYKKYRLSIQFSLDGFSFLVVNPETMQIVEEKRNVADLEQSFLSWMKIKLASEPLFREKYERVSVAFAPQKYTAVPTLFFKEENKEELFSVVHSLDSSEVLHHERGNEVVMLYAISKDLVALFEDFLPQASWKTHPFYATQVAKKEKEWGIYVQVLKREVLITVVNSQGLQLSNSFHCTTVADQMYYVLYCVENMQIPIKESIITLDGDESLIAELDESLSHYHPVVSRAYMHLGIESKVPFGNLLLASVL